jgi:hypothetical protein
MILHPFPLTMRRSILPGDSVRFWRCSMFESLDEQIRKDEDKVSTSGQRMVRYALYVAAAAVVMGGVIFGVHMMT